MNLPNILTLIRILLIPAFVILIIYNHFGSALITFAIAGITDGIDGLLARLTGQRTELGAYLDPIADKLLLSSGFVTLAIIRLIPGWLTVAVISRDVIILLGFVILLLTNRRPKIRPSLVSKITTAFQISTIIIVLLREHDPLFRGLADFAIYGAGFFTVLSGAHYIILGTRILNEKQN
jgi:cardiolipin synthase